MIPINRKLINECKLILNNNRGFTLIEALAATALLGLIIVVFITLSNYMMSTRMDISRAEEAAVIAESTLSEMRLHPEGIKNGLTYTKPSPTYGSSRMYTVEVFPLQEYTNNDATAPAVMADRVVSLQSFVYSSSSPGSASRKLMLLTVTVSWEV